jgi:hypothetical protein
VFEVSERFNRLPFSLEHWASESMQEQADQRTLRREHIVRTQVRFWLLVAAALGIMLFSLALEYIRLWAQGAVTLTDGAPVSTWRWLMGMLPGLLGLAAVFVVSTGFVQNVYSIRDWRSALGYVWLLLFGRAPGSYFDLNPSTRPLFPYPFVTVHQGKIDEKHEDTLLARLGGPGNVIIFNDSAVFLERFGRFTRVAGPGQVFLQRFERIREVLDLRPQERSSVAKALTKDGIPVQTEVQVRFHLARPPASLVPPEPDVPYPVYKWALIHAGQCHLHSVNMDSGEESIARWPERASGVGGSMRAFIAEYQLDELLEPHEPGRDPRREIAQRLYQKLQEGASNFGAQILEVRMGALEPTLEEVKEERITSWQTAWKSEARKKEAMGIAEAIRERGLARAYAQMEIILTLTREFQESIEHDVTLSAEFVALRFIEALRHAWTRPGGMKLSADAVRTLGYLQRMVRREYALPRGDVDHE